MNHSSIMVVIGTRPEAIKMLPVYVELKRRGYRLYLCSTGQHADLLENILECFNVKLDVNLKVMTDAVGLTNLTTLIMQRLGEYIRKVSPAAILVHGDTTTAMSSALSAFYEKIPVFHVEAGLRTEFITSPWPEEMNRRVISKLSSLHFAPTEGAASNLSRENISRSVIHVTGNTVIDALKYVGRLLESEPLLNEQMQVKYGFLKSERKLLLATIHRRENFGRNLQQICNAIQELAQTEDVEIVIPVHPNPVVQKQVFKILNDTENVHLLSPLDYVDFVYLLKKCYLILSDSGGIQEEAPSFGKPVLVLRTETERPEAITAGTCVLVGVSYEKIVKTTRYFLNERSAYQEIAKIRNPFGDGTASEKIADQIANFFRKSRT